MVIGADEIYSKVRRYAHPDIKPIYSGLLAITSAVETSKLRFPEPDYPPVSSIHILRSYSLFRTLKGGWNAEKGPQAR